MPGCPPVDQPTPVPSGQTYDWRGTTLTLATFLPDSPSEADIYLAQPGQHATVEEAVALAQRFGIRGDIYQTAGELPGTTDYMVTDGKQSLRVRSAAYFSYTADMIKSFNYFGAVTNPDADSIIGAFLQSHGFTSPYRIEWSELRGAYKVERLAADGLPLRYEFYAPPMLLVTLDENGQVSTLDASLLDIQADPVGHYGILSAEEALQRVLDPNRTNGIIESMHSAAMPIQQWSRTYPIDQTLTIYGNVTSAPSVQSEKPAFIQIDGFPAVGQVTGLDKFSQAAYVEATGHFVTENGIEKFSVDSWKVSPVNEDGLTGTLQRENDQAVLTTTDGARYVLPDVPDDIPMPFENAYAIGTAVGGEFQWKLIDNRMAAGGGGGGGGGGGSGFYKLNLSGTPVPFPSPTPIVVNSTQSQYRVQAGDTLGSIAQSNGISIDELMQANNITDPGTLSIGQGLVIPGASARPVEGLRGMLSITISKQQDGSQVAAYGFIANAASDPGGYMLLEGNDLKALQAYNNRPVDIWGSLEASHDNGIPFVKVDRFEIPFPDLKVTEFRGTQKLIGISGTAATLFTSDDGRTYVQLSPDGTLVSSLIGVEGDHVQLEALAIPDESMGGYPALRVFSAGICEGGVCGGGGGSGAVNLPSVVEAPTAPENANALTATIEKVELVHFTNDLRYAVPSPNPQPPYFQPVWQFSGHYSNGDEFEILIQALRDEYLLPEINPYLQGG